MTTLEGPRPLDLDKHPKASELRNRVRLAIEMVAVQIFAHEYLEGSKASPKGMAHDIGVEGMMEVFNVMRDMGLVTFNYPSPSPAPSHPACIACIERTKHVHEPVDVPIQ